MKDPTGFKGLTKLTAPSVAGLVAARSTERFPAALAVSLPLSLYIPVSWSPSRSLSLCLPACSLSCIPLLISLSFLSFSVSVFHSIFLSFHALHTPDWFSQSPHSHIFCCQFILLLFTWLLFSCLYHLAWLRHWSSWQQYEKR